MYVCFASECNWKFKSNRHSRQIRIACRVPLNRSRYCNSWSDNEKTAGFYIERLFLRMSGRSDLKSASKTRSLVEASTGTNSATQPARPACVIKRMSSRDANSVSSTRWSNGILVKQRRGRPRQIRTDMRRRKQTRMAGRRMDFTEADRSNLGWPAFAMRRGHARAKPRAARINVLGSGTTRGSSDPWRNSVAKLAAARYWFKADASAIPAGKIFPRLTI